MQGPDPRSLYSGIDMRAFEEADTQLLGSVRPPASTRLMRLWGRWRPWQVGGAAGLVALVLASTLFAVAASRGPALTYRSQQVTQGNLALTVHATGPLQSAIYDVNFSGSGRVAAIDVKVGQQVTAGQALARLDATSLQDAVSQAQATVAAAQTALDNAVTNQTKVQAQTQAQLAAASDQEQSAIQACQHAAPSPTPVPTPTPNPICIQQAKDQYAAAQAQADAQNASAQAQVNAAQAQLTTAQAQLTTAQHNLTNATLTAPHAGTVAVINGSVGGAPGSGSGASGSAVFIRLVDLSALQVVANVNEADIGGLAAGQPAQFTVSAYGSRLFHGTVSTISPLGQTVSNVVTYAVTVDVDMQGLQGVNLLPAMTANITITAAQRFNVLLVPVAAVTFARTTRGLITRDQAAAAMAQARQLLADLQNSGVDISKDTPTPAYVLAQVHGRWVARPVVLGLTDGTVYEVLAGLSQGDAIVIGVQQPAAARGGRG